MITVQIRYHIKVGSYRDCNKWLKKYCHVTAQYSCAWPDISMRVGSMGDISITYVFKSLGDLEIAYGSLVANPEYSELMDEAKSYFDHDKTEVNVWKTFTEKLNSAEN